MVKQFLTILFTLILINNIFAEKLQVLVDQCIFKNAQDSTYIELYFSINNSTITYKNNEGGLDIAIYIYQDSTIVAYDLYHLTPPADIDSNNSILDLKRLYIPYGELRMEITATDSKDTSNKTYIYKEINNPVPPANKPYLSDIALISNYKKATPSDPFYKAGYSLYPYPINYYPPEENKIIFYTELYNTEHIAGEMFLVNTSIVANNTNQIVNGLSYFSKQKKQLVNVIFSEFDISNLPSGNYELLIEIRNKNNILQAYQRLLIQRKNNINQAGITDVEMALSFVNNIPQEELIEDLQALKPITSELEYNRIQNLVQSDSLPMMKRYFLSFWQNRSPIDPQEAWLVYEAKLKKANELYGTKIYKGYETDRGRFLLLYGSPSYKYTATWDDSRRPYEVWIYDYLDNTAQNNVKSVFIAHNTVTNEYNLVYSDIRGEVSDAGWITHINKIRGRGNSNEGGAPHTAGNLFYPYDDRFIEVMLR